MVLTRHGLALALLAALAAACNHSLFDNRPGGGRGGSGSDAGTDGATVPTSCPDGCLGDAAADFDGSATGKTGVWRYFEDQGRAWKPMTLSGSTMMGQLDAANQITTCKTKKDPLACAALSGALLMSSGAASQVDPAIEFVMPPDQPAQVIQLSLHAYLASGAGQTIRVYRNSREDLLFTSPLTAMTPVEGSIVVDALPGDRFLVAISGADAVGDVGLQLFVNATGQPFPRSCQLALPFSAVNDTRTPDLCSKSTFTSYVLMNSGPMPTSMPTPIVPGPGPYMEQSPGISIAQGRYLQRAFTPSSALDWSHDITVQMWVQPTMLGQLNGDSFLFADFDPDPGACGGMLLSVRAANGLDPHITLSGCTDPATTATDTITPAFPLDSAWHFVRVVRNAAGFDLCIDGVHVGNLPVKPGAILSNNPPNLGKPVVDDEGALYVGGFDDVRVFTGALPCRI
jgi:Concanavalin A-like lectin/glucanases superfamily